MTSPPPPQNNPIKLRLGIKLHTLKLGHKTVKFKNMYPTLGYLGYKFFMYPKVGYKVGYNEGIVESETVFK